MTNSDESVDPLVLFRRVEAMLGEVDRLRASIVELQDIRAFQANVNGASYQRIGAEIGKSKPLGQQMVGRGRKLSLADTNATRSE